MTPLPATPTMPRTLLRLRRLFLPVLALALTHAQGQAPVPAASASAIATQARLDELTQAMDRAEKQIEASEHDLQLLRQQLAQMQNQLQTQLAAAHTEAPTSAPMTQTSSSAAEDNALRDNQLATLDQVKVESESRYPLRVTGTLLLNGFVNSTRVDQAAAPTAALGGPGTSGLSVQQTVLGLDADGPHLFGARSRADIRVDFFGSPAAASYATTVGLLRLRTAHAALDWKRTSLFFSLDRPLLNPNAPESLVAVAQPELAWSGNLWSWNPQVGLAHTLGTRTRLRFEAAMIDPADAVPDLSSTEPVSQSSLPSLAERSRRPGLEARIAVLGSDTPDHGARTAQFGIGGYVSPHSVPRDGATPAASFNAWAATLDFRFPLPRGLTVSGSAYRGAALGGLGGGGYKDYIERSTTTGLAVRPLDDIGGWSQLHAKVNEHVSWNVGIGLDNAFSNQLRTAATTAQTNFYGNIARNRTIFANVLYSPGAYLLLSVEYRHLYTAPVVGPLWISHTTGVGAAFRF